MTTALQSKYFHQEVIRNLGVHKCPIPLSKSQSKILKALSLLESFKELRDQAIHKFNHKKAQAAKLAEPIIPTKPNLEKEEQEFTCRLIKTQDEVLSLLNKVEQLKGQRDQLVNEIAIKNIPSSNADPLSKRYGINLNQDPLATSALAATQLFKDTKINCFLELKEVTLEATQYKDSETIQCIANILQVRIAQKGLLGMQKAFLMGEVNELMSRL
jgi:hypothetical protein